MCVSEGTPVESSFIVESAMGSSAFETLPNLPIDARIVTHSIIYHNLNQIYLVSDHDTGVFKARSAVDPDPFFKLTHIYTHTYV
jgi:hypothetical protein